jgi:hypothetical protein
LDPLAALAASASAGSLRRLALAAALVLAAPGWLAALQPPPGGPPAVAQTELTEQVAPGVVYRQRNIKLGELPVQVQMLEVDPANPAVNILPVHALDRASGKELTTSMAKRYGAAAAVNGGYFHVSGPLAGASTGVYQLNGRVVASGDKRSALVMCAETGGKEQTAVASAEFKGTVTAAGGATLALAGMNRPRTAGETVLYDSTIGTPTPPVAGFEVVVGANGQVQSAGDSAGGTAIPQGGWVIAASGEAAGWLKENAKAGSAVKVETRLEPVSALPGCSPVDWVGAGPRLIRGGRIDLSEGGFNHANGRHPRTAFAVTGEGKFLFLTLDGRQRTSAGMTLAELAELLHSMGAVEAINLDGGGSTTMVVNGAIRNSPSDGRERAVSDAILVFSVPDFDALDRLVSALGEGQIEPAAMVRVRAAMAEAMGSGRTETFAAVVKAAEGKGVSAAAARLLTEAAEGLRK